MQEAQAGPEARPAEVDRDTFEILRNRRTNCFQFGRYGQDEAEKTFRVSESGQLFPTGQTHVDWFRNNSGDFMFAKHGRIQTDPSAGRSHREYSPSPNDIRIWRVTLVSSLQFGDSAPCTIGDDSRYFCSSDTPRQL